MRLVSVSVLSLVSLLILAPSTATAQGKAPKRPKLAADADTNSAMAYYRYGMQMLELDSKKAADAFYWATQLEPGWAEAMYALRVSSIRADERYMVRYLSGDDKTRRAKETIQFDSLLVRAIAINPFLDPHLDAGMARRFFYALVEQDIKRQNPALNLADYKSEIAYEVDKILARDVTARAWLAYGEGRNVEALELYAGLLKGDVHKNPYYHDDRANMYVRMGNVAAADQELSHALEDFQKLDLNPTTVYRSKAVFQMKRAYCLARLDRVGDAKDALNQALVEDLAFYPAHLMLGNIALAAADTAEALREYGMAMELAPGEIQPRLQYADLLIATAGGDSTVVTVLTPLVEQRPAYAHARHLLATAHDRLGDKAAAVEGYQTFLKLAPANDPARMAVQIRVQAIELGK